MNTKDQKLELLQNEKMPKVLLKMGIPTMIGMLVSALYSIVDAFFASWLGVRQIGAISIAFPIVQVMIGLGMMFGAGASSYISRLLGRGEKENADHVASTAICISLSVGIISIVLSLIFMQPILVALGATKTILPYASQYAVIYFAGSIFNIFNVTMNHIVTSEGRTKLTMLSMLMGGGLNIIFDPLFMFGIKMGIQGAATATVLAQAITSLMYICYLSSKKGALHISYKNIKFEKESIVEIIKIGAPILLYQLLGSMASAFTNAKASMYGDSAVAAFGVVIRIMTLGTYVVFGFLKGFQTIAGYNYGAGNMDRLKEAIRLALKWTTAFCIVAALIMIISPTALLQVFTKTDATLLELGSRALRANGMTFLLFGFEQVYLSLFMAMGKGRETAILSMSRQGIFFIPAILLMPYCFQVSGIIWAQPVADLCTIILTLFFAMKQKRKMK